MSIRAAIILLMLSSTQAGADVRGFPKGSYVFERNGVSALHQNGKRLPSCDDDTDLVGGDLVITVGVDSLATDGEAWTMTSNEEFRVGAKDPTPPQNSSVQVWLFRRTEDIFGSVARKRLHPKTNKLCGDVMLLKQKK